MDGGWNKRRRNASPPPAPMRHKSVARFRPRKPATPVCIRVDVEQSNISLMAKKKRRKTLRGQRCVNAICCYMANSEMDVIDLFSGSGGYSKGAELAGANIALAIEGDAQIARVYSQNFGHEARVEMLGGEIEQLAREILERFDRDRLMIHGSPPCQRLSQANTVTRNAAAGLELVNWYLDLVERVNPRFWSMEQVNHPEVRLLLERRGLPYTIVNALNFGVPQSRIRIVAASEPIVNALKAQDGRGATVVPKDVLVSLQPPARYLLTSGTTNQPIHQRNEDGVRVTVGYRRMANDEGGRDLFTPCHTIWSKPGNVFDTQTGSVRKLTPGECMVLQAFPPNFQLDDRSIARSYRVVGNSIPPPLARFIVSTAVSAM